MIDRRPLLPCHATCLVLGEDGILIRGASASGKSSLCLALLDEAERAGHHARLVGDDRIGLRVANGRLIGAPHPALVGLLEIRGYGLKRLAAYATSAVIRLVVELVNEQPRFPPGTTPSVEILDVRLPVLNLSRGQPREYLIRETLAATHYESVSSQTHSRVVERHWPLCV